MAVRGAKSNSQPRKRKDERAHLNRNLLNYPLARDARVSLTDWRRGKKKRDWRHQLPGDDRIDLRFTADADAKLRRCPTGFDINVLFCLLREAQNEGKVSIASRSALLGKLGLGRDSANRRRLNQSLQYWGAVTICHSNWREAREPWTDKGGRNILKVLPPPIEAMSGKRRLLISISSKWRQLATRYFERVPLPLPTHAAAQNLVLCLLTSHEWLDRIGDQDDPKYLYRRHIARLCQKIGITHRHWSSALGVAKAWFANHGYELQDVTKDDLIAFTLDRPGKVAKRVAKLAHPQPTERAVERAERAKKKIERVRLNERVKIETTGMQMERLSNGRKGIAATDEEGNRIWMDEYGEVICMR